MGLPIGSRVGAYEILGPIGAGGMGEVYRARDTRLGRLVAIKLVSDAVLSDPTAAPRLAREAQLASALNHPNILTVYDVGDADGRPFIVMELIAGESLQAALDARRMKPARAIEIAAQVADGLAAAHGAGIIHRDLTPRNVMLTEDGRAKIVDFGLSKLRAPAPGADDPTTRTPLLTDAHTVMGTAGYMAPEQVSGRPADFRADQFSLGAILYEMLSGKRAFKRDTPVQTMAAVIDEEPPPLSRSAPGTPDAVVTIVERCLAKDPAERYASTQDLAKDLRHAQQAASSTRVTGAAARPPLLVRRRWLIAAVVLVIVAAGAASAAFLRGAWQDPAREARALLDRYDHPENIAKATDVLVAAVARHPNDAPLQVLLAEAHVRQFERKKDPALIAPASEAASAALKLQDRSADVHVVLAMLNYLQVQFEGAEGEARTAIQLDPSSSRAWRELGRACEKRGKLDDALQAYQKAVALGPNDWTAHVNLGAYYYNRKKDAEGIALAEREFKRVLELAPDNTKAYNNLGVVYLSRERFADAVEMFQRSVTIDPNVIGYSNQGSAYYQQGAYAEAARSFEKAVALPSPTYQIWANLGSAYYWAPGERGKAKAAYETALELGEKARAVRIEDDLLATLADAHAALGLLSTGAESERHRQEARALLASLSARSNVPSGVLFMAASTFEELGDRATALAWLDRAVSAGHPLKSIERSPWLTELRRDDAYVSRLGNRK